MSHLQAHQMQPSEPPGDGSIETHKSRILQERKSSDSFVVIGKTLNDMYYKDKCLTSQREFLQWTKSQLGFSKSTTYEYIISYKIYSEIEEGLRVRGLGLLPPPIYQSHCQLLAKIPKESLIDSWIDVLKAAGDGQVTTAYLESYLEAKGLLTVKPIGYVVLLLLVRNPIYAAQSDLSAADFV